MIVNVGLLVNVTWLTSTRTKNASGDTSGMIDYIIFNHTKRVEENQ